MEEVEKSVNKGDKPFQRYVESWWNVHITACKEYFTTLLNMNYSERNPSIPGSSDAVAALAEELETILISVMIDEKTVILLVKTHYISQQLAANNSLLLEQLNENSD